MEEQRAQTGKEKRRGNGKTRQRGNEYRRAKHGEHVLKSENQQLRRAQLAGIADTVVLHGENAFVHEVQRD